MTKWTKRIAAMAFVLATGVLAVPLKAQWIVHDPTSYFEIVAEYEQLVRQYEFMIAQARRVPVNVESRYHAYSLDWTYHDLAGLLYAQPLLTALNVGDVSGAAYRSAVQGLDVPTDIMQRLPPATRQRLASQYSTIELSDSMARLAIDQTGGARADGPLTLQAIRNVEHDAINPADEFHTQTALLEKIDSALAIELRLNEQTNQFQLSALEQSIVDNKRKRDAEATLMNATIRQWRYGKAYGDDLFGHTAANIDNWRPY
jgi:hypothetical protein